MDNIAFSWVNYAALARTIVSASASVPELPVQRLKDPVLSRRMRTPVGTTDLSIVYDFGAEVPIGLLVIAQPFDAGGVFDADGMPTGLLAPSDQVRYRLSDQPDFTVTVYDSASKPCGMFPENRLSLCVLPAEKIARYCRIDISAPSLLASSQFIDLGYVWAGPVWQPTRNLDYGYAPTLQPLTQVSKTPAGARYSDVLPSCRVFSCNLPSLTESETYGQLTDMLAYAGAHRPCCVLPDPQSQYLQRQAILGFISAVQGPSRTNFMQHACGFTIEQAM